MSRLFTAAVLSCFATGAAAQDVCTYAPTITMMADFVLEERVSLPRLKQPRFGDTAAFMAIRYGGRDGTTLLENLSMDDVRPPRLLGDLLDAYNLTQPNGLASWQTGGADVLDRFIGMLPSTRRALLLADNGETYFNLLTQVNADEDRATRLRQSDIFGTQPAFVISDQPDDVRVAIAQRAEDGAHLWAAAAILGDLSDRGAFDAFMVRHADAEDFATLDPSVNLGFSTIGTLVGDTPLRGPRLGDVEATLNDLHLFTTMRAGLAGHPSDFLNIFLNQSGQMELSALAGQTLLDAIAAGDVDPVANPEAAWLLLYRTLLENGDKAAVQQTMATFNWPSQSIRYYAGYAIESLDVMVATDALGPYMRGDTDTLAGEPDIYSGSLPWADWTRVADLTRAGTYSDLTPEDVMMTVELLWEAAFYTDAAAIAASQMESDTALEFMRDAMMRLDAKCGHYIGVPGGAIRYGGMAVYTFD